MSELLPNDETLIERLRGGDNDAFAVLYHRYVSDLFRYANNVLKDAQAAEDIVQELFANLWRSRMAIEIRVSVKAYLYTANRYLILRAIRDRKKQSSLFENLELRIWGPPDPENLLYQKELKARALLLAEALPEKCREIYILSREQQLSNKEIAQRLGIAEKTVENQLTIALKKLRSGIGFLLAVFF